MSEHDIADCPKCGKRDFVLKEDNHWVCLKCGHTQKMPKSGSDSDLSFGSLLLAAFITALILFSMLSL